MKKNLSGLCVLCLACLCFAACSGENPDRPGSGNSAVQAQVIQTAQRPAPAEGVDMDLTVLSSTMAFAEIYNMLAKPNDYVGKTIKLKGAYLPFYREDTEKYHHYILTGDAAACCQIELEFVLTGEHSYPDDYPVQNASIELLGAVESYEKNGRTLYHIIADDVAVL